MSSWPSAILLASTLTLASLLGGCSSRQEDVDSPLKDVPQDSLPAKVSNLTLEAMPGAAGVAGIYVHGQRTVTVSVSDTHYDPSSLKDTVKVQNGRCGGDGSGWGCQMMLSGGVVTLTTDSTFGDLKELQQFANTLYTALP